MRNSHHVARCTPIEEEQLYVLSELAPGGVIGEAALEVHVAGAEHRLADRSLFRCADEQRNGGTDTRDGPDTTRDFLNVNARIRQTKRHRQPSLFLLQSSVSAGPQNSMARCSRRRSSRHTDR